MGRELRLAPDASEPVTDHQVSGPHRGIALHGRGAAQADRLPHEHFCRLEVILKLDDCALRSLCRGGIALERLDIAPPLETVQFRGETQGSRGTEKHGYPPEWAVDGHLGPRERLLSPPVPSAVAG